MIINSKSNSAISSPSKEIAIDVLEDIEKAETFLKARNNIDNSEKSSPKNVFVEPTPLNLCDLSNESKSKSESNFSSKKSEDLNKMDEENEEKGFKCSRHNKEIQSICILHSDFLCSDCIQLHQGHISKIEDYNEVRLKDQTIKIKEKLSSYRSKLVLMQNDLIKILDNKISTSTEIYSIMESAFGLLAYPQLNPIHLKTEKRTRATYDIGFQKQSIFKLDKDDEIYLKSLLKRSALIKLIFRASKHGFSSHAFHSRCDHKGPTFILAKGNLGNIFGGFTSKSWRAKKEGKFYHDESSFLFSLTYHTKHLLKKGEKNAIYCDEKFGPTFGKGWDLSIRDNCHDGPKNTSKLGCSFYDIEGIDGEKYLAGDDQFKIYDYEVYSIRTE